MAAAAAAIAGPGNWKACCWPKGDVLLLLISLLTLLFESSLWPLFVDAAFELRLLLFPFKDRDAADCW